MDLAAEVEAFFLIADALDFGVGVALLLIRRVAAIFVRLCRQNRHFYRFREVEEEFGPVEDLCDELFGKAEP